MNLFQNKKAIITGASRGIGKAIAFNLAENGCNLFLVSRTKSDLEKVRNEILNDYKVNIFCYELDITNFESVEKIFKKIIDKANTIDILVNNAGITQDNIIARMTIDEWNKVIQTNLTGYFNCCRHIIRHMIKNKYVIILKNDATGDLTKSLRAINNIIQNNKYNTNREIWRYSILSLAPDKELEDEDDERESYWIKVEWF